MGEDHSASPIAVSIIVARQVAPHLFLQILLDLHTFGTELSSRDQRHTYTTETHPLAKLFSIYLTSNTSRTPPILSKRTILDCTPTHKGYCAAHNIFADGTPAILWKSCTAYETSHVMFDAHVYHLTSST